MASRAKKDEYSIIEERLGCRFNDRKGLKAALTHSSTGEDSNYERLEFLGDRVVNLVMAQVLYEIFPDESEGGLAKRHAALVQGTMLADLARSIDLGAVIKTSEAERMAGGAQNDNILADGLEAVIGALFLDSGLDICRDVIARLWGDAIHAMQEAPQDPKTALQEWAQGRGLPLPVYEVVGRKGPDHAPLFDIRVSVEGYAPTVASGSSRRTAEKEAARLLLEKIERDFA